MPAGPLRALAFALAIICTCFGAAHAGGVHGIVVDGLTFRPVDNATVSIPSQNLTATTDKTGNFHFTSVAPGRVEFRVDAAGFDSTDQRFKVPRAGLNELVLVVKPSRNYRSCPRLDCAVRSSRDASAVAAYVESSRRDVHCGRSRRTRRR